MKNYLLVAIAAIFLFGCGDDTKSPTQLLRECHSQLEISKRISTNNAIDLFVKLGSECNNKCNQKIEEAVTNSKRREDLAAKQAEAYEAKEREHEEKTALYKAQAEAFYCKGVPKEVCETLIYREKCFNGEKPYRSNACKHAFVLIGYGQADFNGKTVGILIEQDRKDPQMGNLTVTQFDSVAEEVAFDLSFMADRKGWRQPSEYHSWFGFESEANYPQNDSCLKRLAKDLAREKLITNVKIHTIKGVDDWKARPPLSE